MIWDADPFRQARDWMASASRILGQFPIPAFQGEINMDVTGPSTVNGATPISRPAITQPVAPTTQTAPMTPKDEVEISAAGRA